MATDDAEYSPAAEVLRYAIETGDFTTAIERGERLVAGGSDDAYSWYVLGQCYRFMGDYRTAVKHLQRAATQAKDPQNLLALGIAHQLAGQLEEAEEALVAAVAEDPDLPAAYNSLALTRKKMGALERAAHDYDAGARALARVIVNGMENDRRNPILKHRDTEGELWTGYAIEGALFLAASASVVERVAFPNGAMALDEERTERHQGLYFTDTQSSDELVRLYLPNYFNTFRERLRSESTYSNLIGNRGTVLEAMGRDEEAEAHFMEANEFLPGGAHG